MEGGRRGENLTSSSQIPESATNADNRIYSVLCKLEYVPVREKILDMNTKITVFLA